MMKITSVFAALMLSMMSCMASANFIQFDEGVAVQPGLIEYGGSGGALYGRGIDFNLASDETAAGLSCVDCLLNFETGANITEGPGVWTFGGGGFLSLTGTVFDGLNQIFSGDIVTGTFTGTPIAIGADTTRLFAGAGTAVVAQPLLDFYSIPGFGFSFANTELGLDSCTDLGGGGFTCGLQNADLAVRSAAVPVPVPAPIALFGAVILAAGLVGRKAR